jgi:hypothetical protein
MSPSDSTIANAVVHGPDHDRRWLILIVLAIAQLMVVLDATVINIALPTGLGSCSRRR